MPNRKDSRSPFSIMVRIHRPAQGGAPGFYGTTHDISESGLLLTSGQRLEVGEVVSISFYLARDRKQLELEAEVIRTVFENTASGYRPGEEQIPESFSYGVHFTDLGETELALLREHVARFA